MNTLRTYAILWLSGLIAGVIVMERWRRTGKRLIPPPPSARTAAETVTGGSTSSATPPTMSWVGIAGARSDAARAQQFVRRVAPWTGTGVPTPAEVRRWSQAIRPQDRHDEPAPSVDPPEHG